MNKKLLAISILTLTLLLSVAGNIARAGISPGRGGSWKWLGYAFFGYDSFLQANVYAYEFNSTATLSVTVYNDYVSGRPLNISALKVGMDWGTNYTSALTSLGTPYVIPWQESRVVPIIFTVPSQAVVSNRVQYSYTIYLEAVNSTTVGGKRIVVWDKLFAGTNFAVYSSDQVSAQQTMRIVNELLDAISDMELNSSKAKLLVTKAENETFVAGILYGQGDFAGARTHYNTALSLANQALAAEEDKGVGFDEAQVDLIKAQAKAIEAVANYQNGLSSMWVLIGVGVVLFGIGYIIRGLGALRKPSVPTA